MAKRIPERIFISYSRKDAAWLARVESQLSPLVRAGLLQPWIDRGKIEAGDRFSDEIMEAIDTCSAAILLVSPNFQNSDFIHENELPRILNYADQQEIRLYWILLADCLLADDFAAYHAVNDSTTPLEAMSDGEVNRVLAKMARNLRGHVTSARANPEPTSATSPAETHPSPTPAIEPIFNGRAVGMQLDISGARIIQDPTVEEMKEAIDGLKIPHDPFLILGTEGYDSYIQCCGDAEEGFDLEYQEGSIENHYQAINANFGANEILARFLSYAAGGNEWHNGIEWEKMDL